MLLTHLVPDHIIVGQSPPSLADLRGFAKGGCVQVAENFEAEFGRKCGEEVDLDEVSYAGGDVGELRETALGEDALQHEVAVFGWCGGEERPNM